MDWRAGSDFQVFTLQMTDVTTRYMKTKRSHYVVRVDNSRWQPLPRVVSLLKSGSAQCSDFFTFKCALMSCGSRSGAAAYTFPFDRMGSIDLLNSSSSIIMLVSDFSFSRPMLHSQTEPGEQLVTVRCALCAGLSGTPPRMESSAAWGRGDTTSSKSLPQTISRAQWWLKLLYSILAPSHEPWRPEAPRV